MGRAFHLLRRSVRCQRVKPAQVGGTIPCRRNRKPNRPGKTRALTTRLSINSSRGFSPIGFPRNSSDDAKAAQPHRQSPR